jgi:hypothetical protein
LSMCYVVYRNATHKVVRRSAALTLTCQREDNNGLGLGFRVQAHKKVWRRAALTLTCERTTTV